MDFSRNDSVSIDSRKNGNRKKKKRSAKQIERCRKYRERLTYIKQKNTDTGINPCNEKISTDTGINSCDAKQNNSDTGINPRDRRPIDKGTGINPDNENCDKHVVQQPIVPPFQIPALYIPGATAMHQPFYFFSPGIIPPAHFVRNTCISSRNTWNPAMFPSRQSDIDETRGQASAQEIPRIPIEDSATNEDFISSNDIHSQEDDSEIITADNESIDINSNDTDNNNTIPDHITSPDNDRDGNRDTDHDIFGIMDIFVNSNLHCVLSKDANMGNNFSEDKDFGYSYFCMANLLK